MDVNCELTEVQKLDFTQTNEFAGGVVDGVVRVGASIYIWFTHP